VFEVIKSHHAVNLKLNLAFIFFFRQETNLSFPDEKLPNEIKLKNPAITLQY